MTSSILQLWKADILLPPSPMWNAFKSNVSHGLATGTPESFPTTTAGIHHLKNKYLPSYTIPLQALIKP